METGCDSLHRLKHKAVITLIIVFSLLFYIICIYAHYYYQVIEIIGSLKNINQQLQQTVLSDFFSGSITLDDGKYVLMKNGYQFSGQYYLLIDSFLILFSLGFLLVFLLIFFVYDKFLERDTNKVKKELDYLKKELEHYLFGASISRNSNYKECNYLLDRLEQKVQEMSILNKNELNHMIKFHQDIIHQINTPLNTIKILIEYLYANEMIDQEYLVSMNYAIQKAADLANIYLRLSKLDTKKVKSHFEFIELYDMVNEILDSLKVYSDYYNTNLINECDHSLIYVDAVWMKEAIENIVKNCIENAGENRIIIIKSNKENEETIIYIDDSGKKFTTNEIINFDRFESSQTGIGIGLHLCKQVIEAHLGDVKVVKNSKNDLRFIIKLPRQCHKKKVKMEENDDEINCRNKVHKKEI